MSENEELLEALKLLVAAFDLPVGDDRLVMPHYIGPLDRARKVIQKSEVEK